jgi:hypothetical protein
MRVSGVCKHSTACKYVACEMEQQTVDSFPMGLGELHAYTQWVFHKLEIALFMLRRILQCMKPILVQPFFFLESYCNRDLYI